MARVTVFIPDDLLENALEKYALETGAIGEVKVSHVVQGTLLMYTLAGPTRADASERGRLETLRAVRAAVAALGDVEATLSQAAPVKRRVRRYSPGRRAQRGT